MTKTRSDSAMTGWLFLSLLGSGVEPVLVKYVAAPISAVGLITLKALLSAIFVLPLASKLRTLRTQDIFPLLWVSSLALLTNGLIFLALDWIPVTVLISIITTTPIFVGIANHRRGRSLVSRRFFLACGAVLVGMILSVGALSVPWDQLPLIGLGVAMLSVLFSTLYRLRMDILTQEVSPLTVSVGLFLCNGLVASLVLPLTAIPLKALRLGVWLAFAGVLANVVFLAAIKQLGATRVSVLSVLQRPVAIVFGVVLLGETMTSVQILGIVLICFGVYFAKAPRSAMLISKWRIEG